MEMHKLRTSCAPHHATIRAGTRELIGAILEGMDGDVNRNLLLPPRMLELLPLPQARRKRFQTGHRRASAVTAYGHGR
jgi:hypothetical protein